MDAKEFVERFGWDEALININSCHHQQYFTYQGSDIKVSDLKTLVDAYELVQFYHGLEVAKTINYGEFIPDHVVSEIKQAIKLVESVDENDN